METWSYRGFDCKFTVCSYSCPELKLFGYARDTQLYAAIRREARRREERADHWERIRQEAGRCE